MSSQHSAIIDIELNHSFPVGIPINAAMDSNTERLQFVITVAVPTEIGSLQSNRECTTPGQQRLCYIKMLLS